MLKKSLCLLTKVNSYMPLVVLPMYIYIKFNNILLAGASIVLWRLLTYYKYKMVSIVLQSFECKVVISLLLLIGLANSSLEYNVLPIVLVSSMLPQYLILENVELKINRLTGFILIIIGMIAAGFLLYQICYIIIYYTIFDVLLLLVGRCYYRKKEDRKWVKLVTYDIVNVFFHNFHYYLFAFSIPILIYISTENYYMVGISCSVNWILFLPKDYIFKWLRKYFGLRFILAAGFIVTSLLLVIIGLSAKIIVIMLCLFLQGLSAGVSECFWDIEHVKVNYSLYNYIWKSSGILGGVSGALIGFYSEIKYLFYIGAFLAFIGGIMNVYLGLAENKNHGCFKFGH